MYDRIIKLLGEENIKVFNETKVLLIGLGGVGGYVFESLIRTGFKDITIIDKDVFDLTNLNRQVLATKATIGKEKVNVAAIRAKTIDDTIRIKTITKYLQKEDITPSFLSGFDYVIDACDDTMVKVTLMTVCAHNNIKLISSMGTANRTHPELLTLTKLKDTRNDPLAKKIRHLLKDDKRALNTPVLCSIELPKKSKGLGTICAVPMAAGSIISAYVINDIKKEGL